MQSDDPIARRKRRLCRTKELPHHPTDQVPSRRRRHQPFGHNQAKPRLGFSTNDGFGIFFRLCQRGNKGFRSMNGQPLSSACFAGIKNRLELGRLKKS